MSEDPFWTLLGHLEDVRNRFYEQEEIVREVSRLVGELDLTQLAKAVVNSISDSVEIWNMQMELDRMQKELAWMQKENNTLRAEAKVFQTKLAKKIEE